MKGETAATPGASKASERKAGERVRSLGGTLATIFVVVFIVVGIVVIVVVAVGAKDRVVRALLFKGGNKVPEGSASVVVPH